MSLMLVTGVTGQDGSLLAKRLADQGHDVHGTGRAAPTPEYLARLGMTYHRADLERPGEVADLIRSLRPDVVFNLGGLTSVAASWDDPVLTARVNGMAVVEMLEASAGTTPRGGGVTSFVQASSSEIFGAAADHPQTESTPIAPISPYGAAKAFAHFSVQMFRGHGLRASNAILYNHESPQRPVTFVTRKIIRGVAAIATHRAETISLGNLDARRDWSWAADVVAAIDLIGSAPQPDDFIVASGTSRSVRQFVATAFHAAGIEDWESYVETDDEFIRPADAPEMCGDASRIQNVLGWRPSCSFEELVRRMVDHDIQAFIAGSSPIAHETGVPSGN